MRFLVGSPLATMNKNRKKRARHRVTDVITEEPGKVARAGGCKRQCSVTQFFKSAQNTRQ